MKAEKKREFEKQVVSEMIGLYYKKNPNPKEQEELTRYALMRIDRCPFMETKTFCSRCRVHCYQKEKREQIRMVMRYAGPRMLFHHPIMAVRHLWLDHEEKLRKPLYILVGFLGLILGILGAILPLLPAFPFLLMAAWGFARSSERLHTWFIGTNLYKKNIQSWVDHRAMDKPTKIRVLSCISLVMGFGWLMMKNVPIGRMILLLVWLGHVIYFVFGMKTLKQDRASA